ncbi:MAG TPA: nucleotide exchange factor GrpE [Candidatus Limnocylindria bacterium]|jgi:molecular chaperone GrpE
MDDQQRRAEELLEERMKARKPNGATATEPTDIEPSTDDAQVADDPTAYKADLQRMAADFANYRKRNEAERGDFAKFAKADLITKLLDVLDGYDRALASVPDDASGKPWVEGMWLVERKLRKILDAEGLEPVDSLGKPFDPYLHEAVAHVESDQPEGTVIEEHQKAYRLHDRVIRPALVSVAKAPHNKNKEK